MKKTLCLLSVAALLFNALPLTALAQEKRVSPHETISTVIDETRVMIVYGRPYTKKPNTTVVRKIWGGLVPYGKVWRLGADEATLLVAQKSLSIGGSTLPAGAYSLFLLPQADGTAKLIINKEVGQWGEEYNEKADVLRVDLKKAALDTPVDQFTMAVAKSPEGASPGGIIKLSWENTEYSVSFTPL
jgi:hypothetical protein